MSENPFQSPQKQSVDPGVVGQQVAGRGYVKQIPVIASLMIAQGALLMLFAILMTFYAFVFGQMDQFMPDQAQQDPDFQQMMDMQKTVMPIVFGVMAVGVAAVAIMHFIAAYYGFGYKNRVFGIVTMGVGLLASLTCYCAPTAIGLAVYGMIIYFNPAVVKAFALKKQGMSKEEILAQFPM